MLMRSEQSVMNHEKLFKLNENMVCSSSEEGKFFFKEVMKSIFALPSSVHKWSYCVYVAWAEVA